MSVGRTRRASGSVSILTLTADLALGLAGVDGVSAAAFIAHRSAVAGAGGAGLRGAVLALAAVLLALGLAGVDGVSAVAFIAHRSAVAGAGGA